MISLLLMSFFLTLAACNLELPLYCNDEFSGYGTSESNAYVKTGSSSNSPHVLVEMPLKASFAWYTNLFQAPSFGCTVIVKDNVLLGPLSPPTLKFKISIAPFPYTFDYALLCKTQMPADPCDKIPKKDVASWNAMISSLP